eukprot:4486786-Prymnesium_polylepis.1
MMLNAQVTPGASLKVSRYRKIFSARLRARGHPTIKPYLQLCMGGVNKNSILTTPRPWSVMVCLGVT